MSYKLRTIYSILILSGFICLFGCVNNYPLLETQGEHDPVKNTYRIGPGDQIDIQVWRNQDLTLSTVVRPDGNITMPLIDDVQASGKTPMELAKDLEEALAFYVKDPIVTVMMAQFVGTYDDTVRVVGEALAPQSIPYREGMTLLDVMIVVGGLTEFAHGNNSVLVRHYSEGKQSYRIRLDDLIKSGDIEANALVQPGDILIIPEAWI